jgi:hypothetical protein
MERCRFHFRLDGSEAAKSVRKSNDETIDMRLISCIFNLYKIKTSKGSDG